MWSGHHWLQPCTTYMVSDGGATHACHSLSGCLSILDYVFFRVIFQASAYHPPRVLGCSFLNPGPPCARLLAGCRSSYHSFAYVESLCLCMWKEGRCREAAELPLLHSCSASVSSWLAAASFKSMCSDRLTPCTPGMVISAHLRSDSPHPPVCSPGDV